MKRPFICPALVLGVMLFSQIGVATAWASWEETTARARKEGKVVVGIAPSAELRRALESVFTARFPSIQLELVPVSGPALMARIASEYKAGVKYFDVGLPGAEPPLLLLREQEGIWEPLEPNMVLGEVKNPANWWGGHLWIDNVKTKKFIYPYFAYISASIWYNSTLLTPQELQISEDFLKPKLKGKIGLLDPRKPGSGQLWWSFFWKTKGQAFLRMLVGQDLLVLSDLRQLAEALVKGKIAVTIGVSYYTLQPFVQAGLPVKAISHFKDGNPVANGNGAVVITKDPPHPNSAKVFVNWLLSKEGQEVTGKAMRMGTRRLDVDTGWLKEHGVEAAKDIMTLDDYHRQELHLESTSLRVLKPAREFARSVLK